MTSDPTTATAPPSSRRTRAAVALVAACLLFGACDQEPLPDYVAPMDGVHDVFVVAHEDDDLLFMNPELSARVRAGHEVETVYLTAGDAGSDEPTWRRREAGVRAAYAYMAGVDDVWSESVVSIAGKPVVRFVLRDAPWLRLSFLRLPDGNLDGAGFGHGSLLALWEGRLDQLSTLGSLAPAGTYTHAELVAVLAALLVEAGADELHTLDATGLHSRSLSVGDHSDHVISARLALEASLAYAAPLRLSMYRTYNLSDEPANLSDAQFDDKRATYLSYLAQAGCADAPDLQACLDRPDSIPVPYGQWMRRLVAIRARPGFTANLEVARDGCLAVARDGVRVHVRKCAEVAAQRWTSTAEGELRGPAGRCLTAARRIELAACDGSPGQRWRVLDNGQIRGLGATCLDARDGLDGDVRVSRRDCVKASGQVWTERP